MPSDGERITAKLAVIVQERRKAAGLSMEELAAAAGVHRTAIGLIESGKRGLSITLAGNLAAALGTPLSELISDAEQRARN